MKRIILFFITLMLVFTACGRKEPVVITADYLPDDSLPVITDMDRMEIIPLSAKMDLFIRSKSDYGRFVVFSANTRVKDFRLYNIAIPAGDEIVYHCEKPVLHYDDLSADKSLVVYMQMPETVPWYGISYTDENGDTVKYAIHASGMDGSVILEKFE